MGDSRCRYLGLRLCLVVLLGISSCSSSEAELSCARWGERFAGVSPVLRVEDHVQLRDSGLLLGGDSALPLNSVTGVELAEVRCVASTLTSTHVLAETAGSFTGQGYEVSGNEGSTVGPAGPDRWNLEYAGSAYSLIADRGPVMISLSGGLVEEGPVVALGLVGSSADELSLLVGYVGPEDLVTSEWVLGLVEADERGFQPEEVEVLRADPGTVLVQVPLAPDQFSVMSDLVNGFGIGWAWEL